MFRHTFSMEQFRHRLAYSEALPQMVALSIICGLLCGIILGGFRLLLETVLHQYSGNGIDNYENLPIWLRFILPIIGSLLLIALFSRLAPNNRQVGIAHLLERMAYHQGNLPVLNIFIQFLTACIALLTGHSVGKEGPAVHMGAACGSQIGQNLGLPNNTLRILAGCGTAAGISAMFNTPLAGVLFAMEVVLLEYTVIGFMPIIVAAATSALVVKSILGQELVLTAANLSIQSLYEIPYIVFLGCMIGLLAVTFIYLMKITIYWTNNINLTYSTKFLLAGFITGVCAIAYPQIMGDGFDTIVAVFQHEINIHILLGILIVKSILTPIILGLGIPAGLIGPTLFIGAVAGSLLGIIGAYFIDVEVSHYGFYALLGMASMMGAVINAPMAALVAILELTGNPNIIFPAMISIVISNLIARYLFKMPSVFVMIMKLRDMDYRYKPLTQILSSSAVQSLMTTNFIGCNTSISKQVIQEILTSKPEWILLNTTEKKLLISPGDLRVLPDDESQQVDMLSIPALRLDTSDISCRSTLQQALDQMVTDNVNALCIIDIHKQVSGLLTRDQIEQFYRQH